MENNNREPFLGKLLVAFIISILAFGIIFFISYQVSYSNYMGIKTQNVLLNESLSKMDALLLNKVSCNNSLFIASSELLDENGARISILETRLGVDDPIVIQQKKIYSELEYKHYLLVNFFNSQCGQNFYPFLFFYSNGKEKSDSQDMGSILSTFKSENPGKIMVYSFDADLNQSSINLLKDINQISSVPIVVSPNGAKLSVYNIAQLEHYINSNSSTQ